MIRSGGQILVDQLLIHGADMAFCVPGESYLAVLDALHDAKDRLRLINARHEAGASNMAEAYGKLTGRPGICLVTRGPGACQGAVGVHIARQDSTPMIMLVGQVARDSSDREAFQEIDYRQMFGAVAKWTAQIERADRIPEYIARAFQVATSGRPGPVVLALPEDMLTDRVDIADAPPFVAVQAEPSIRQLDAMRALLARAKRPLMLVGGHGWTDAGCTAIRRFAELNGLPAACSFRRQDVFDERSEHFVGDLGTSGPPALIKRVKEADLLLVVGARLGEMTTQLYTLIDAPKSRQILIHVHPDADEIGRVYIPNLAIAANQSAFALAASAAAPLDGSRWAAWRKAARQDFLDVKTPSFDGAALDMGRALLAASEKLPDNVIVTLDAGNHTGWPQRFLRYGRPGRQVGPTAGSMGYSVPAAVAASLVHPDRVVLGCVGDGGFMMSGQEIATAVQHGGKPIILVMDNRMYGTIRMHQEREHPTRISGTDLKSQIFVAFARALGAHGELVTRTEEFGPALERAIACGAAALIELRMDPEYVTTRTTLTAIRTAALKRLAEAGE